MFKDTVKRKKKYEWDMQMNLSTWLTNPVLESAKTGITLKLWLTTNFRFELNLIQ